MHKTFTLETTFLYSPLGKRTMKEERGKKTFYLYDGDKFPLPLSSKKGRSNGRVSQTVGGSAEKIQIQVFGCKNSGYEERDIFLTAERLKKIHLIVW